MHPSIEILAKGSEHYLYLVFILSTQKLIAEAVDPIPYSAEEENSTYPAVFVFTDRISQVGTGNWHKQGGPLEDLRWQTCAMQMDHEV